MATTLDPARPFPGAGEVPARSGSLRRGVRPDRHSAPSLRGAARRARAAGPGGAARARPVQRRRRSGSPSARAGAIDRRPGAAADRRRRVGARCEAGLLQRARALNAFVARRLRRPADLRRRRRPAAPARDLERLRAADARAARPRRCRRRPSPASTWSAAPTASAGARGQSADALRRRPTRWRCAKRWRRRSSADDRAARRSTATSRRSARRSAPPPPTAAATPARRSSPTAPSSGAWYEHQRLGRELGIPVVEPRRSSRPSAGASSPARGRERRAARRPLPPPRRGPAQRAGRRPDRARRAAAAGAALGPPALRQRLRHRPRRRQARARLRSRDDPLLPRRGAAAALGPELRPLRRRGPASGDGAARRAGGQAARRLRRPRGDDHAAGDRGRAAAGDRAGAARARSASSPRRRSSSPATRPSAAAACAPRRVDLRPFVVSGRGRRPARCPAASPATRAGAGEMIVNSSRGGGCKDTWVVDGRRAAMKRRSLASRRERPLIGVTTSEVRAGRARRRRLPRASRAAREMALGLPYLRGLEAAGGAAAGDAAAARGGDRAAARPPRRHLPLRRPRPRPRRLRRRAARRAGADRARPRPLRAGGRPPRRRPRDADPGDLPRHPGAQHRPRRRPAPAPARALEEIAHRQSTPGDQPSHPVAVGAGQPPGGGARDGEAEQLDRRSTSTPSTTRRSTGSARASWSAPAPPTARSRRSRTPSRPFLIGVQWHAETLVHRPYEAALFRSFVDACRDDGAEFQRRSGREVA